MRPMLLASAAAFLAMAANAEPLVVFQSLHNLNYAEAVCGAVRDLTANSEAKIECALVTDPRALGRRLEFEVQSGFAANTRCAGVTVIRGWNEKFDGGDGHEYLAAQAQEHWDLLLNFEPGSKEHGWSLFRFEGYEGPKNGVAGEGPRRRSQTPFVLSLRDREPQSGRHSKGMNYTRSEGADGTQLF
jgi:hypothetical protein